MTEPASGSRDTSDSTSSVPAVNSGMALAIVGTSALAIGAGVLGWRVSPLGSSDVATLLVLILVGWVSSWLQDGPTGSSQVRLSFTNVVLIAAIPLVGPFGACLVAALTPVVTRSRQFSVVQLFNSALLSAAAGYGALTYLLARGLLPVPLGASGETYLLRVGLPLFVANVVITVLNALLLTWMVRASGGDWRAVIGGMVRETMPLYLGYTVLAFLFVILWIPAGVGPLSAALIMAPLLIARWVYVQYGDEYRSHVRILETLVTASSGNDLSGPAHSRRVEAIAVLIGDELGLGARGLRDLRHAAILHDIGRVGIPHDVLRVDPATLTPEEIELIRRHPVLGEEIVRDIDFLADTATAIRHHHERFDGGGYPDGLAGTDIPYLARILAVADAADWILSGNSDDGPGSDADLVAELTSGAGAAFDPGVAAAFKRVIGSARWRQIRQAESHDASEERAQAQGGRWREHDNPGIGRIVAASPPDELSQPELRAAYVARHSHVEANVPARRTNGTS